MCLHHRLVKYVLHSQSPERAYLKEVYIIKLMLLMLHSIVDNASQLNCRDVVPDFL